MKTEEIVSVTALAGTLALPFLLVFAPAWWFLATFLWVPNLIFQINKQIKQNKRDDRQIL